MTHLRQLLTPFQLAIFVAVPPSSPSMLVGAAADGLWLLFYSPHCEDTNYSPLDTFDWQHVCAQFL